MKKAVGNLKKLLTCCLCTAVLISSLPVSAFAANDAINVWTENNLVKVLPVSNRTGDSSSSVNLVMAKNEYEAGQIILKSGTGFNINSVEFTDLTGTSGTLTKDNFKFNFVDYMQLYTNSVSWWHETEYVAKGYTDNIFPEKLINDTSKQVAADIAQSIWITAYTPKSVAAGTYSGTVTVSTDRGDFTVPLSLEVYDVTVPDPADGEYKNMAWTATAGYTGVDQYVVKDGPNKGAAADPVLAFYPDVTKYSSQWWDLMEEFCKSMRENRISNYWVPTMHLLIDGGTTVDADGTVNFNWSRFDEVIDFFLKNGSFNILEGSHFLYGGGTGAGTYTVAGLKRDENGKTVRCNIPYDDEYTEKFAKQFFKALDEHLKTRETNGRKWSELWTQYLGDEPSTDTMTVQWLKTYDEWLHPNAPDMKTHVAVNTMDKVYALEGRVNTWVPILNMEDTNIDYFRNRRDKYNEQFINYICGGNPCQTYPNRHIDIPYAPLRMLAWYNFEMGIPGTLSWAYNYWWLDNATAADMPGDNGIVYPDPDNNKLISSARAAQLRDGIEEYELFRMLQNQNKFPGLADKIVKSIVKSGLDYSIDPNKITAARTDLIKAAAGEDVTYKYADEHQYANAFKSNEITVDGKLDERAWFNIIPAEKPVGGGSASIAADFGVSWDGQNMYIGLKVSDPTGNRTDFTNDSMSFFISPSNNRTQSYAPGDFQVKVSDRGAVLESGTKGAGNNDNIDLKQLKVASDYTGRGYTMEIAVPWTQIGLTPSEEIHIGFDLMAVGGNENGGTLVWSGNENDSLNPQNFGELTLKSEDITQMADSGRTAQVSLDGTLNESCWADFKPVTRVVTGSSDTINAGFETAWDKQNFYVGVKVNDPSKVKTDFTHDSISLYFAPKNFRGTPYSRDDFQLQISNMGKTVAPGAANVGRNDYVNTNLVNVKANYTPEGYSMEIAIPWSEIGVTPKDGYKMGFDIMAFDGGDEKSVVEWSGGNWINTEQNGTLSLRDNPGNTVPVISVVLDKTAAALTVFDTLKLSADVNPYNAAEKTINWTSSDDSVASVNQRGFVTALKEGTAVITAAAGGQSAQCTLIIAAPESETGLNMSKDKYAVSEPITINYAGTTSDKDWIGIYAAGTTPSAINASLAWGYTDYSVKNYGSLTITPQDEINTCGYVLPSGTYDAVLLQNDGYTELDRTQFRIVDPIPLTKIVLNTTSAAITRGQKLDLNVTPVPSDTTDDMTVNWSSSNSDIAYVNADGRVTGVIGGTAVITASAGGCSDSCVVEVSSPLTGIKLDKETAGLSVGETINLKVQPVPSDTTDSIGTVTWQSSDENVARVDGDGTVTAVSSGTARITAETGGFSAVCDITVTKQDSGNNGNPGNNPGSNPGNNPGGNSGSNGSASTAGTPASNGGNQVIQPQTPADTKNTALPKKTFTDLGSYNWAEEAVNALAADGIISGTSETTFSPEKNISRADFLIMLIKALNLKADFSSNFKDVSKDSYYYNAVGIAKQLGITNGTGNNLFNPKAGISRQDMMVLIVKALKLANVELDKGTAADMTGFSDYKNVSSYAQDAVETLIKEGIIVGSGNSIRPKAQLTRAEAAVVIYKIYKK